MLSFTNTYSESMRGLTAQVTALLRLPEVTVQAFAEDGVTSECVLHGKLTPGKITLLKIY